MNEERLLQVLVSPVVSEKSTRIGDKYNQVVFRVLRDAPKREIKQAVEHVFKVEVERVRTVRVKGKRKAFQRTVGRRSDWKKAYVTLKPGHDIDFLGAE